MTSPEEKIEQFKAEVAEIERAESAMETDGAKVERTPGGKLYQIVWPADAQPLTTDLFVRGHLKAHYQTEGAARADIRKFTEYLTAKKVQTQNLITWLS